MGRGQNHHGTDTVCVMVAIVLFLLTLVSTKGLAIIDDPEVRGYCKPSTNVHACNETVFFVIHILRAEP